MGIAPAGRFPKSPLQPLTTWEGPSTSEQKHPTAEWMIQMARNAAVEGSGCLRGMRYFLHDRDTKFCTAFLDVLRSGGIRPLALPPSSPNRNAFAERWVSSVRQECLSNSFCRRSFVAPGVERIHRTSSFRTEPPGSGQPSPIPFSKRAAESQEQDLLPGRLIL